MMVNEYPKVAYIGIGAIFFSLLCLVFKCSSSLNTPFEWMRILGDFLFNIAISLIAAEIFFVFQVVIPENKRNLTMRRLMVNSINDSIYVPLSGLRLEIVLLDNLYTLSEGSYLADIPESIKLKPIRNARTTIKKRLQNIKENIDSSIKMYYAYMPDDILALLEKVQYSSIMDGITLYNDFSDLDKKYEEILPLLDCLSSLIISEDTSIRNVEYSIRKSGEIVRNNIQIIAETQHIYDETTKK